MINIANRSQYFDCRQSTSQYSCQCPRLLTLLTCRRLWQTHRYNRVLLLPIPSESQMQIPQALDDAESMHDEVSCVSPILRPLIAAAPGYRCRFHPGNDPTAIFESSRGESSVVVLFVAHLTDMRVRKLVDMLLCLHTCLISMSMYLSGLSGFDSIRMDSAFATDEYCSWSCFLT